MCGKRKQNRKIARVWKRIRRILVFRQTIWYAIRTRAQMNSLQAATLKRINSTEIYIQCKNNNKQTSKLKQNQSTCLDIYWTFLRAHIDERVECILCVCVCVCLVLYVEIYILHAVGIVWLFYCFKTVCRCQIPKNCSEYICKIRQAT